MTEPTRSAIVNNDELWPQRTIDALRAERDALIREREEAKEMLGNALDSLALREGMYDALERQRDCLANELVEVKRERDRLETANVALQIGWAKALDETQRYREAAQKAQTAHANEDDAWQAGYQKGVSHGLDHLTPGLEKARTKLAKAEEERAALCDRIVELSKERDAERARADGIAYERNEAHRAVGVASLNIHDAGVRVAWLVQERDDARRQMVDMKREVEATHEMFAGALAELGIAKRRIEALEEAANNAVATLSGGDCDANDLHGIFVGLRRVATGKE